MCGSIKRKLSVVFGVTNSLDEVNGTLSLELSRHYDLSIGFKRLGVIGLNLLLYDYKFLYHRKTPNYFILLYDGPCTIYESPSIIMFNCK